MTNQPRTKTAAQQVAEQLTRRVVNGQYPPGGKLPTERELAVEFGVTRPVVREALQRLAALRLVNIRHGSGIYVESFQLPAAIELFDVLLTRENGAVNERMLLDMLDFRAPLFRGAVRLAAVRRTDANMQELRRLLDERKEAAGDPERLSGVSLAFLRAVTQATQNFIYLLISNTMGRFSVQLNSLLSTTSRLEEGQFYLERLLEAFERRDAETADLYIQRYLETVENRPDVKQATVAPTEGRPEQG